MVVIAKFVFNPDLYLIIF